MSEPSPTADYAGTLERVPCQNCGGTGFVVRQPRLTVVPLTLKEANEYVGQHHRHHRPVTGHRFSFGVKDENGNLRGVAIIGRPVARMIDWRTTVEVVRVATDGAPNACSALYGAARAVAREMGFRRIITYTLESEPGTSLRAAGWRKTGTTDGGEWGRPSRAREVVAPIVPKQRWEVTFGAQEDVA